MKKITLSLMLLLAIILLPSVIFAADGNVAKIGDTEYSTLQEAINNASTTTPTTITLITDDPNETTITGGGFVLNGQNVVIDFAGKTYNVVEPLVGSSGTETNGCQLLKGTITFNGGTFTSSIASILIQNYSNLTLQNMTLKADNAITQYALSNNCGVVSIEGNTSISVTEGNYAFDMCWGPNVGYSAGTQITVNTTGNIKGNIQLASWGTIYEEDLKNITSTLTINKVGEFNGYIFVKKDFLTNQLKVSNSYEVRETDNLEFILMKLNPITIAKTENGEVTLNKSGAAYEDLVELTIVPDTGYIVQEVIVRDNTNKQLELIDGNKFSMPNGPVTVTVVFDELIQKVEAPTINKTEEVKDVTIGVSNLEAANKILLDSLLKDKNFENIQDKNVKVQIGIEDKKLSDELKTKMIDRLSTISNNMKLSNCFDISISVKDLNNLHLGYLTRLSAPMEFTIGLSNELQQVPDGFTRKFYIVYEHDGEIKTIDNVKLSADGRFATFNAFEFSTYAIAYEDVKDVTDSDVPKTGDYIAMYTLLATLSVIGIVVLKKVNNFKSKH